MTSARRSAAHLLLAGMILSALPTLTLARQSFAAPSEIRLTLPAKLTNETGLIEAVTEINTLDLNQIAGNKIMTAGDVVYVHLNVDVADGNSDYRLSYPYAISQNRPQRSDERTISLRGVVSERVGDKVSIRYLFETLPPHPVLKRVIKDAAPEAKLTIDVNRRAVGHIHSITVDGLTYSLRN